MVYRVKPDGEFWNGGVFCVPVQVVQKSLKFASEKQLKALLYLLSNSGVCEEKDIAKALSCSEGEAAECLDFWCYEGVISKDGAEIKPDFAEAKQAEQSAAPLENLPMPNLTPKDIVGICYDNPEIAHLLLTAESILGSTLSNALKSNLVNMVTYYGLTPGVVITLLEYYKSERDAGRNITTRKLQNIAKEWAGESVETIEQASAKLLEISEAESLWLKVIDLCAFDYRQISSSQTKMLARWRRDFDNEMIFFACNTMKKYTDKEKQSIKAIDNILKEWKRKGFSTPDEVKAQPKTESKASPRKGKLKSKPTYNLEEIKKRSELNDDFDI